MNTQRNERFGAIARLFRYPGDDYAADARALADRLESEKSKAADAMREVADYANGASLHELEETYTRTFDLNPSCSPEIGWHLFGEEYVRGLFMVHMREQMRERGLEETGELPDHVAHVLAVLGVMDEQPAREMARACLCPAVGKMLASIDKESCKPAPPAEVQSENSKTTSTQPAGDSRGTQAVSQPFRPLVLALAELVLEEFGLPNSALEATEEEPTKFPDGVDPLHSMPCGGCGDPDIVSLDAGNPAGVQYEEKHS